MDRDQVVRAFNAVPEAFPCYEDHAYPVGTEAVQAADLLARLEHRDAVLRHVGEAIGEVDHYSEATALASAGWHAARALLEIVSAGVGDAEACAILGEVEPVPALDISRDAATAYGLVESVLEDLLEDARLSCAAASDREVALGKRERGRIAVDAKGHVDGIPAEVLEGPSAQGWCMEFAEDAANIVEAWTDEPDPDDDSEEAECMRRGAFTGSQIRQAVTHMVMGQGYGPVSNAYYAYQSAAFDWMNVVDEDGDLGEPREDPVETLFESGRQVLVTARAWAACSTAFAALDDRLNRFRPARSPTPHDK